MDKFKLGDEVIFKVAFENADERINVGDSGVIKSGPGPFRSVVGAYYFVVAKKIIWMVKEDEMESRN